MQESPEYGPPEKLVPENALPSLEAQTLHVCKFNF